MATAIEFENVGKQYRLGLVSTQTLSHDLNRWWTVNVRHKEDPYLRIGEVNDRSVKGSSDYVWALRDINFKVEQGDVVGIIGRNGAGKSTLLKLLSKVTAPTTGHIRGVGRIGSLLEVGTGFHPEMTGRENIYMNGAILGMTKQEITRKLDEIVDFSGCERYLDTPVKRYSSGMMVRLGFAVAAHLDPEILVVDEVLAVGDAEFQKKAIGKMQDVSRGEGRTVLFVSHNMGAVKNLCKNGIVLRNGMVAYSGTSFNCVDFYLQDCSNLKKPYSIYAKEETVDKTKEVVFLSISLKDMKDQIEQSENISFEIDLFSNASMENCRINTTIFTIDGTPIGGVSSDSFFSTSFNKRKKVILSLYDHHLVPGKYYASFSVGIGNYLTGQRDFEIVQQAVVFSIVSNTEEDSVVQWDRSWGNMLFPFCQKIIF